MHRPCYARFPAGQACFLHVLSDTRTVAVDTPAAIRGGSRHMARARRKSSAGVIDTLSRRGEAAVRRTVRRVSGGGRRSSPGGDLVKAVKNLVKALPLGELEKRLAGLEKTVQRLEGDIRKAVGRAVGTRGRGGARKRATTR